MAHGLKEYNWQEAIEYTRMLSKIDTYNPAGKLPVLKMVEEILREKTNSDVVIYDGDTDEPFLVAKLCAENPSFKLLIEGHLDVVSPEGVDNPFDAEIRDGIMYGRGVCDMKGGCGSLLAAFIAAAQKKNRKGEVYLMFSTDEEYASQQIIKALDKGYVPKCDFAMIAEPTDCSICTAHKGNAWMDVEFFGKSAHASTPELGVNAIYMASDFVARLKTHIEEYYEAQRHEVYGVPTINVGVIEGGSKPNLVPPYAKVRLDKRYLPGDTYANFVIEMQELLDACKAENSQFEGKLVEVGDWSSVIVDRNDERLGKVHQAVNEATGEEVALKVMAFWGEGGFIQRYDIPVVYYGPGHPKYAHTPDEQIPIDEISKVAKGYYGAMMAVCF